MTSEGSHVSQKLEPLGLSSGRQETVDVPRRRSNAVARIFSRARCA